MTVENKMTAREAEEKGLLSEDIANRKRAQFEALFPEVVSDGAIDVDHLRRVLGEWVEPSKERYGLNWPGKAECMKAIQASSIATLKPAFDEGVRAKSADNVFIEGDNLEVLKLMQKSYFSKVDLIYIDPPYNTDGDFIYPDSYTEDLNTYLSYTNQLGEDGRKFSTTSESDGRYHSKWLSMIYPRLYLARNLLSETGVILCHIDEHELHNLIAVMNEVFGAKNDLGIIVWDKKNPKGDSTKVAVQHEYLLAYARDIDALKESRMIKRPKRNAEKMLSKAASLFKKIGSVSVPDDLSELQKKYSLKLDLEKYAKKYSLEDVNNEFQSWLRNQTVSGGEAAYKHIDENGEVYRTVSMAWPNKKKAPDDYFIPLKHPVTGKDCPVPDRGWRNPPATMKSLLDMGLIVFGEDETKQPERKYLLKENMSENVPSILPFGGSDDALLKELEIPFDNPKPLKLAKSLIKSFAPEGGLVMDFFAGSATVGHACLELNAEGAENYQFILVQLPEVLDKSVSGQRGAWEFCKKNALPHNISEVSKERLRRALASIASASNEDADGFSVFKLSESNFAIWAGDPEGDLAQQLALHIDHVDEKSRAEDILYELLIKSGFGLTESVERRSIEGKDVFAIADGALLICLDTEITPELVDALADAEPVQVICLDAGFKGNDQLKTNAVQTFKSRAKDDEEAIVFRTV